MMEVRLTPSELSLFCMMCFVLGMTIGYCGPAPSLLYLPRYRRLKLLLLRGCHLPERGG